MHSKSFAAARLAPPTTPTEPAPGATDAEHPGRASAAPSRIMSPAQPPTHLSPRAVLSSLFSFEALFVLYIFAGLYKGDSRFAWIPVDPTALFFALSVVVGGIIILRKGIHTKGLPIIIAMGCLITWLWVSLLWSPSRIYGPQKVFYMATLVLWALMAGALIIAPDPKRTRRLFTVILLLSLWGAVDAVVGHVRAPNAVYHITTVDKEVPAYLLLGLVCGPGALIALAGWLHSRGRKARWLYLGLFLVLGFVLAIAGGRAPFVFAALPALVPIALSLRLPKGRILLSRAMLSVLVLLLAAAGGLVLYKTATDHRLATFDRMERLAGGNPRIEGYAEAIEIWHEEPLLGAGTGSWPLLTGRGDRTIYPHNLFLELGSENGLVGVLLFLALLWVALRPVSVARLRRDPQALCALMVFTNLFLISMEASDLPGSRAMFMMLGVLALFAIRPVGAARAKLPRQPAPPVELSMTRGRHASATDRSR
jgi:O-antigen ligase